MGQSCISMQDSDILSDLWTFCKRKEKSAFHPQEKLKETQHSIPYWKKSPASELGKSGPYIKKKKQHRKKFKKVWNVIKMKETILVFLSNKKLN